LVPVLDQQTQGVTNAEFNMIQEVIKFIDRGTVSQTTTGAKEEGGNVTATQIMELQRQARVMMGLTDLAACLLEKKLTSKRLMIILENWFDPIDTKVDEARNLLNNRYRIISRKRRIEGKGQGLRMVIPTKELPTSEQIKEMEESFQRNTGTPLQMIMIDPDALKKAKLTWIINVVPKEKKSSEYSKVLFGAMMADARNLGLIPSQKWLEERFAEEWEEDPSKMFAKAPTPGIQGIPGTTTPPPQAVQGAVAGKESRITTPQITLPIGGPTGTPREQI